MPKLFASADTQRRNGNRNFGVVLGPATSDRKVLRPHESEGIFRQGRVKQDSISGLPVTLLDKQLQSGHQTPHKGSNYGKTSVRRNDLVPVVRNGSLVKQDTFSPFPEKMGRPNPVYTSGGYPNPTRNDPFNGSNSRFSVAQNNDSYSRRRPGY